jgi:predicted membrane protein
MLYNTTRLDNATGVADTYVAVNDLSGQTLSVSILVVVFLGTLMYLQSRKEEMTLNLIASSLLTLIVAALLFSMGGLSKEILGIPMGVFILTMIWYSLTKK